MKEYPLRLDRYFFTEQEVKANPGFIHDQGTPVLMDFFCKTEYSKLDNGDRSYGIVASVSLNQEGSQNPPYFFSISAFGIVVAREDLEAGDIESMIEMSGAQMLLGAIRERLAEMTGRGPWGAINLDFVPLPLTKQK
jgi:preprotein translocase subunit SecB